MPGNKYLMAASTGPMTFTKTTADESYVREARTTGPIEQVSDADNLVGHRFYHVRVRAFVPFPLPPLKGDSDRTSRCDPRKAVVIVDFTHKGVVHRVWPSGLATHTVFIRTQQGSVVRALNNTHKTRNRNYCLRQISTFYTLVVDGDIDLFHSAEVQFNKIQHATGRNVTDDLTACPSPPSLARGLIPSKSVRRKWKQEMTRVIRAIDSR